MVKIAEKFASCKSGRKHVFEKIYILVDSYVSGSSVGAEFATDVICALGSLPLQSGFWWNYRHHPIDSTFSIAVAGH